MKILVACEESQIVCKSFRDLGNESYSCDLEPCSGGHPEWHIQADVIPLLNGRCEFHTCDGKLHEVPGRWDMIISFPPCTYLTFAGNQMLSPKRRTPEQIEERKLKREQAAHFFFDIVYADCDRIAIENPKGYMNQIYRKPDQIIQPYYFGDPERKTTCLWLKGLPPLLYLKVYPAPQPKRYSNSISGKKKAVYFTDSVSGKDRAKIRSKTFPSIAAAMAAQWTEETFRFLAPDLYYQQLLLDV